MPWFFPKEDFYMVLDIGTEAAKCIIFCVDKKNEAIILGAGLDYYRKYVAFNAKDIDIEVRRRSVEKSIEEARRRIPFSSAKKEFKEIAAKNKKFKTYISLPPDIFKARVVTELFLRKNPKDKISSKEAGAIKKSAIESAKKKVGDNFVRESGILPGDIEWNSSIFLSQKIDGYSVPDMKGYEGKEVELKILLTFMPVYYYNRIKSALIKLKFKIEEAIHPAECIEHVFKNRKISGVAIDIGGEITQAFGFKDGELQRISDFPMGAKTFKEILCNNLGINEESARIMLEEYESNELSKNVQEHIKEMFSFEKNEWYNNFKTIADDMASKGAFLSYIFLMGGGAFLPEIAEAIEKIKTGNRDSSEDHTLNTSFKSLPIDFNEIKIQDALKIMDNPQWSMPLLLSCGARSRKK